MEYPCGDDVGGVHNVFAHLRGEAAVERIVALFMFGYLFF